MNPKNKKTVWKTFWLWQYEEEEAWLNRMAAEGWALEEVHIGRYVFVPCQPGEYIIRMERLSGSPEKEENQEYIWFVRGTGADYLGKMDRWVYFRKKAEDGPFELFSDLDSRLAHVTGVFWVQVISFGFLSLNALTNLNNILRYIQQGQLDGHRAFSLAVAVLYLWVLIWSGYGSWKLWHLRKKIKAERSLRE